MTEPEFAPADAGSRPLWLVAQGDDGPLWPEGVECAFAKASGFAAKPGQICLLPGEGGVAGALFGVGKPATPADRPARERFTLARAADNGWGDGVVTPHALFLALRYDRPVNTVKTWLHRSLAALKDCLGAIA